jgi:hypothetical protein
MRDWRMFSAFAIAIAPNVLEPAATSPAGLPPPPVSEARAVAVPPPKPAAPGCYTSGDRSWMRDQRIDFSNDHHPWREGAPLRYATRFRT